MPDIKPPTPKVDDVSKPSAPSATAKPVIVSNRPQVEDPTLVAADKPEEEKPLSHNTNKIEPAAGSEERIAGADGDEKDASPGAENASDDASVVGAVAENALAAKKEDPAELEKQAHLKKLIDEKTLFVKISEGPSSSSVGRAFLVLLFAIVLVGVVGNFLIDAGMIDVGISSLTNLL